MTMCQQGKGGSLGSSEPLLFAGIYSLSSAAVLRNSALRFFCSAPHGYESQTATRQLPSNQFAQKKIALLALQLHPRHLTRASFRVLNVHTKKFSFNIFVSRKKFRANMRHVRV